MSSALSFLFGARLVHPSRDPLVFTSCFPCPLHLAFFLILFVSLTVTVIVFRVLVHCTFPAGHTLSTLFVRPHEERARDSITRHHRKASWCSQSATTTASILAQSFFFLLLLHFSICFVLPANFFIHPFLFRLFFLCVDVRNGSSCI